MHNGYLLFRGSSGDGMMRSLRVQFVLQLDVRKRPVRELVLVVFCGAFVVLGQRIFAGSVLPTSLGLVSELCYELVVLLMPVYVVL